MMKNLPREQVILLEDAFKKARKKKELLRIQALLLLTQGYKQEEVAKIVRISIQALRNWITAFRKHGIVGILEKGQPGNHRKLTNNQKERLTILITTKTPSQLTLVGNFWNPSLVSQLIQNEYHISYQREASRKLLHACGFSFHKPNKVNNRQKTTDRLRFTQTLKKDSPSTREVIRWYW